MRELKIEGESMRRYTEEEKAEIFKEVESLRNVSLVCFYQDQKRREENMRGFMSTEGSMDQISYGMIQIF